MAYSSIQQPTSLLASHSQPTKLFTMLDSPPMVNIRQDAHKRKTMIISIAFCESLVIQAVVSQLSGNCRQTIARICNWWRPINVVDVKAVKALMDDVHVVLRLPSINIILHPDQVPLPLYDNNIAVIVPIKPLNRSAHQYHKINPESFPIPFRLVQFTHTCPYAGISPPVDQYPTSKPF